MVLLKVNPLFWPPDMPCGGFCGVSIYTLSSAGVDGSKQLIGFISVAASAAAAAAAAAGGLKIEQLN